MIFKKIKVISPKQTTTNTRQERHNQALKDLDLSN